jgi:hypothetical protein
MPTLLSSGARIFQIALVVFTTAAASGCGSGARFVPVSGKVRYNNAPLTLDGATVRFTPDTSKGNAARSDAFGVIDDEGNYTMYVQEREGAPLGWYKVAVIVPPSAPPRLEPGRPNKAKVDAPIPIKYANPDQSGLRVEVVEQPGPGQYDLALQK